MKIKFKSTIKNQGEPQTIEFISPVTISDHEDFKVYEFIEPQNNVMNRIEVKYDRVNIFAGPSTIILVLDELIQNDYQTDGGSVMFDSELKNLAISENYISMDYELGQVGNPFGSFKIELEISE